MRTILFSLIVSLAACAPAYQGTVAVSSNPDLVEVTPGVRVIPDYGESIFFVDGFYWWYVDGMWYRSGSYTDGWVYIATPPPVIIGLGDPFRYRHYRPPHYVVHQRPVPVNQIHRPAIVRDHRRR